LARAGEQHGSASSSDSGSRSGGGDIESIDLAQSEEGAESIGELVQADTHPSHHFVVICRVIGRVGEHFQPVVWIHFPRAHGVEEVVYRILPGVVLVGGMNCLIGWCSFGFAEVVDDFEFHDAEKPGAEGGATMEGIDALPGGAEAVLNEIFGSMVVVDPRESEAVKRIGVLHHVFNGNRCHRRLVVLGNARPHRVVVFQRNQLTEIQEFLRME